MMIDGWNLESRRRSMDYGLWIMDYGLWIMDYGSIEDRM